MRSTSKRTETSQRMQTQLDLCQREVEELQVALAIAHEQEKAAQKRLQELEMINQALQQRDRLLEMSAIAANSLLTAISLDAAINYALQIIGEALDTDRVVLIETVAPTSNSAFPGWRALGYEWNSPGTVPLRDPEVVQGSYEEVPKILEQMHQGQSMSYLIEDMPEPFRSEQMAIGVKSTHLVPIFVKGQWWGVLGLDDCREAKQRSAAELAVLRIVADCIGSAIQQQRTQQALLETEQTRSAELEKINKELQQRDRLLSVVAQVTKDLLEAEDVDIAIPAALQTVGEAATMSRVLLILERQDPATQRLKHCVEFEWVAPGISDHAAVGMAVMDNENFQVLIQPLYAGQAIWRTMEKLPEVTRSQFQRLTIKSTGVVPIFIEGQYVGCVAFDDCVAPRHWTQQEIDVLTAATESIGAALHRKQLVDRLLAERIQAEQEQAAELAKANEILRRTAAQLINQHDLNRFLERMLLEIAQETGAFTNAVFLYDRSFNTLKMHNAIQNSQVINLNTDSRFELWKAPVPADTNEAWQIVQSQGYTWHGLNDDELPGDRLWKISVPWHQMMGHRRVLTIFLQVGDEQLGFMGLGFRQPVALSAERLELVQALANQTALAIQLTRLAEEAKQAVILEERNRVARDIHDTLAQVLTGVIVQLQAAEMLPTSDIYDRQLHLTQARLLAQQGLTEARRSVQALRPQVLEQTDLAGALSALLQQMTAGTALQSRFRVHGNVYPLSADVETQLLRIGQEALTNLVKHANASEAVVELSYQPGQVQLRVQDDGQGFVQKKGEGGKAKGEGSGYGLVGMQERSQQIGATLSIASQVGVGTTIQVNLLTQSLEFSEEVQDIRVLIADDHVIVLQGLAALIERQPGITVVAQAQNGREAIDLFRTHQPDVALIDLRMPVIDGVEVIALIRQECPTAKIVILTTYDADEDIYRGLQAGAMAYLLKGSSDSLPDVIRAVHAGEKRIPSEVAAKLANRVTRHELTNRELEVLRLIVLGQSNKEISISLQVSEGTVRAHINNILSKLRVRDRTQAATLAIKQGLVRLE
jgi:DNA-binding NarL/FixJ family response regulator/signal transduction histidine kinase